VTEKMDGENTTLYRDGMHARSVDSRHHASRDWVKQLHGRIAHENPEGWRLCGENVYARHSVSYDSLESYFFVFSILTAANEALSWSETREWADLLGLAVVPVLYEGAWDAKWVRALQLDTAKQEGYVVRLAERIAFESFTESLAKWARRGHVQTSQHWMSMEIVPNGLR